MVYHNEHKKKMFYSKQRPVSRISNGVTGFTLAEMIVVIVIISFILGIAIPSVTTYRRRVREAKARADIESLGVAIQMYYVDNGSYPSESLSGLVTDLESGGYMEFKDDELNASGEFIDPWGNSYHYDESPPSGNTNSFNIWSNGQDGNNDSGGGDDINNW